MSAGIGAHTGTALHSGYALGRNSSKVMAPPGGVCSDIFGTGQPRTHYGQNTRPESAAAQQQRNESSVFRSPCRAAIPDTKAQAATIRGESKVFSDSAASPMRRGRAHIAATSSISQVFASDGPDSAGYVPSVASPKRRNVSDDDAAAPAPETFGNIVANNKYSELHGYRSTEGPASGKSRSVHTSSKVMAPPGGRSQITFG